MEKNKKTFMFQDLTPEEKEKRGILARLTGPCASIAIPTRNGRFYSESLWSKVFEDTDNSTTMEMFKNGGMPMELDHPADRLETCSDRIAAMMPEPPQRDDNNQLVCCVDLIDTPCGKIAYQLAKYGFNLGISSRGNGETYVDESGNESVDPNTYDFQTFDLVLLPALKEARLTPMMESLNGKTLKQALNESLNTATPEDRKIMEETLKELNIDYQDSKESNDIDKSAAKDTGADLVKTLQESILAKENAEAKITELQEKLSVCYAKEASMEEDLEKYKTAIRNLSEKASSVKTLQSKLEVLTEELNKKDGLIQESNERYEALRKSFDIRNKKQSVLNENLSNKQEELTKANRVIRSLNERMEINNRKFNEEKNSLNEKLEDLKKDYVIKQKEYSNKLSNSNKLVEQYKNTAKIAVEKYIENKAKTLGITKTEVLNKLPDNYSFNDIDKLCESLSRYNLQVNSLPFDVRAIKKASLTESKTLSDVRKFNSNIGADGDDIDEDFIRLAESMSKK